MDTEETIPQKLWRLSESLKAVDQAALDLGMDDVCDEIIELRAMGIERDDLVQLNEHLKHFRILLQAASLFLDDATGNGAWEWNGDCAIELDKAVEWIDEMGGMFNG